MLGAALVDGRISLAEFDERSSEAYSARFRSELANLTLDLVPPRPAGSAPAQRRDDTPDVASSASRKDSGDHLPYVESAPAVLGRDRVDGRPGPSSSVAVMGGTERAGVWHVPTRHQVVAVMGGIDLDLREAHFESLETTVSVTAVMGGVDVVVPADVHLEVSGIGVMGAFERKDHPSAVEAGEPDPSAPLVRVNGVALMGGVTVHRRGTARGQLE